MSMSRPWAVVALSLLLCLAMCARAADVTAARLGEKARVYEVSQWRIDPGTTYKNPFNPDEVMVDAIVTSPKGVTSRVPAFWYQAFATQMPAGAKEVTLTPGETFWMVRICPTEAGDWSLKIRVKDAVGERESAESHFTAAPADVARGFVRVAANKRYFAYDSGEPYFIVGLNLGWGRWGDWVNEYESWLTKLSANGGNFARIWTTQQKWIFEHPGTGLNRYDLAAGAYYDGLLASAQKHGVGVMLTLTNHRDLLESDMWGKAPWPDSPYNAAKGGPATRPVDFFTNPKAREAFKKRLRYVVARYGAFTSIAFWELFNEQEWAGLGSQEKWNQEMSSYLQEIDPYHHLVTTSCQNLSAGVWNLPAMACTQVHYYGDDTNVDVVTPAVAESRKLQVYGKPQLLSEFGISYKRSDEVFDPQGKGTALHNALWSAMMAGAAGGGCTWWWDSYVDPRNLWREYKPFADYARNIEWSKLDLRPMQALSVERDVAGPATYADAVIPCTVGWERSHGQTVTVFPNGKTDRPMPQFLFSIGKPELRTPTVLSVNMPKDGAMIVHVDSLCDFGVVRVSVDGVPVRDLAFSSLPGAEGIESTKPWREGVTRPYIAVVNKDYRVAIPAGKHTIALDNVAGDWVKMTSVTFTNCASTRYANLLAMGLQDAPTSQTLLWVLDTRSNWKGDKDGIAPETLSDVQVTCLATKAGKYQVMWWDTRAGKEIRRDSVDAAGGQLKLKAPAFMRDVAAMATPAQ